jgi:hypothetical protein
MARLLGAFSGSWAFTNFGGFLMTSFQLAGIAFEPFSPLFALSDQALAKLHARRVIATKKPGFPCRVSLADAEVGEELLLLPFEHQPADSPYRGSGPIFVRRSAAEAKVAPGVIPEYVRGRLMSVRAYDSKDMMVDALVCDGAEVATAIGRLFDGEAVAYIHLHNAKPGCFSCRVNRIADRTV